jgi:GTP-binding protein EngB required for normal cell division
MDSNKSNIIDLRIILLGASNVGKKSIDERLKILKSTER